MLQPILENLNRKNIILASRSPRRKDVVTALVSLRSILAYATVVNGSAKHNCMEGI